ncbi:MAG: hypothetical protein JNM20_14145 [Rhizobiales bacterium]|nr:hypothetical protein [Hyphomicrobiales bacterium]
MDFKLAIERNRAPLLVEVLKLFAMIGLTEGATIERISRPLHRQVMGILRKAESAVRRLIVAAARDIVLEPEEPRPARPRAKTSNKAKGKADGEGEAKEKRKRRPLFNLFDQLKRSPHRIKKRRRPEPRIQVMDLGNNPMFPIYVVVRQQEPPPAVINKADDGMVSAKNLLRRLIAAADALQDIPRHAMRLARWHAKPKEERRPERWSPLRPGRPPGFRQRARHVVDEILKECHWLALQGNPPLDDTS